MKTAFTWGTTPEERERPFGADRHLADAQLVCWRGIDVEAPPPAVFRRLCQLRVAPYSYDWIDNLGRRSPRELLPGLEVLEVGQWFMGIFELVDVEPDRSITLLLRRTRRVFGDVAVTYEVVPAGDDRARLLAKLRWRMPGWRGRVLPGPAAFADLVMMRKQFRTLKELAEGDHRRRMRSTAWHRPRNSLLPPPRTAR